MFHSLFTKNNYNIKKAWDDFYQLESSKDIVDESDRNLGEGLQDYINSLVVEPFYISIDLAADSLSPL